jgi:hypothetical protein
MHQESPIGNVDNGDAAESSQAIDELAAVLLIANIDGHVANDVILFETGDVNRSNVSPKFPDLGSDSAQIAGFIRDL